jgi:hypothetical protein
MLLILVQENFTLGRSPIKIGFLAKVIKQKQKAFQGKSDTIDRDAISRVTDRETTPSPYRERNFED